MTEKKENEKDLGNETKAEKSVQDTELKSEQDVGKEFVQEENEEQLSSLDMLWHHVFNEMDEWAKRSDLRDEMFLKEAMNFAETVQRNQGNLQAAAEQFNKEFAEWERTAREEFLMSTTTLQHFFPIRSYENINEQLDQIQKKTMLIINKPCQAIANNQAIDKYIEIIDQYIALRKKGRMQYIKTVKQAGNLIYENQKGFVNLFARQIKTLIFPLNKYLEKSEELTKS